MEKIQSANNQLFASIDDYKTMDFHSHTNENHINKLLQSKHRVTFSSDVEEYEVENSEDEMAEVQFKDVDAFDKEISEIDEELFVEHDNLDELMENISVEEKRSNCAESGCEENDHESNSEVAEGINNTVNDSNVQSNKLNLQINVPLHVERNGSNGDQLPVGETTTWCKTSTNQHPNRIKSACMPKFSANRGTNHQDDLLNIHLGVRACCENKYLDNNRLPRYNGYISQYGMSKDQLDLRESNRQKNIEKRVHRVSQIMRAKQEIADLNEQAFRQWLIRKNHVTQPKYKNMFDSTKYPPKKTEHLKNSHNRSSIN